jgi:hypothetical protein
MGEYPPEKKGFIHSEFWLNPLWDHCHSGYNRKLTPKKNII